MTTKHQFAKLYIKSRTRYSHGCTNCGLARYLYLLFPVICFCHSGLAVAQTAADKPVLLVIETAQSDAAQKRERAFISELQLALDRYRVVSESADGNTGDMSFKKSPLNKQLQQVRNLSKPHRAAAVIWLSDDNSANLTLLHLAALSSGRALIRIVEAENGPNTEVTLAMAVDELVGQAYLFDAKNPAAAVEASVISAASKELSGDADNKKAAGPNGSDAVHAKRSFHVDGIGRIGIAGNHGPRVTFGGSMGIRRLVTENFFMGGGFNLIAGPFEDTSEQEIKNLSLAPKIGLGVMRLKRLISMGAAFYVSVPWQQTIITLPGTGSHVYTDINMRFALLATLCIPLGKTVAIALSPDVGLWLNQKRYYAISSNRDIVRNPRLDVGLNIGLVLKH